MSESKNFDLDIMPFLNSLKIISLPVFLILIGPGKANPNARFYEIDRKN
ncbi:MAG: hypothetical protein JEZ03_16840 [Bacteroidales bacterium]|nr:hypothetical protein [Bacteroidales bacterium]